jgi:hypothetical protein
MAQAGCSRLTSAAAKKLDEIDLSGCHGEA